MQSSTKQPLIAKFSKFKGFTISFIMVGLLVMTLIKQDSINDRVTIIETKIVNPCVLDEKGEVPLNVTLRSSEECRKGLVNLLRRTSSNPDKAIELLGLNEPLNRLEK